MSSPNFQTMQALADSLRDNAHVPSAVRTARRRRPVGIDFRALTPADREGVFQLFDEPSFRREALTRDAFPSFEDFATWLSEIVATERFEIVAINETGVLGFAGLYRQGEHMSHTGALMMGVREKWQGRGIGGFLLQLLVLTAWLMAGLEKISLTVFTDNLPAIRLYESAGFEIEGMLRRFVRQEGRARDAYAMGLLLVSNEPSGTPPAIPY
jgi:putative acetyltransferase